MLNVHDRPAVHALALLGGVSSRLSLAAITQYGRRTVSVGMYQVLGGNVCTGGDMVVFLLPLLDGIWFPTTVLLDRSQFADRCCEYLRLPHALADRNVYSKSAKIGGGGVRFSIRGWLGSGRSHLLLAKVCTSRVLPGR